MNARQTTIAVLRYEVSTMDDTVDLAVARAERAKHNSEVDAATLLKLALKDIEDGAYNDPKQVIVLVVDHIEGASVLASYRCGMSRVEELGYMYAFTDRCCNEWTG